MFKVLRGKKKQFPIAQFVQGKEKHNIFGGVSQFFSDFCFS